MSNINNINQTNPLVEQLRKVESKKDNEVSQVSFGDTMKDFLSSVNAKGVEAGKKVSDIVEGKSENLVGAMATLEESKLSFQLMLEIRNKLLESYKQIERMQV